MKKLVLSTAALALISGSAFASKARLEALGQDKYGSAYVHDARGIFSNPAWINEYNNFATFEWGNPANQGQTADTEAAPEAEGGVFVSSSMLNWGIYLGNEADESYVFRALSGITLGDDDSDSSTTATDMLWEQEVLNLFVGSESGGVKWGAALWHSDNTDGVNNSPNELTSSSMGLRLGAMQDAWRFGLTFGLGSESVGTFGNAADVDAKLEGDSMYRINFDYDLNDRTSVFVEYSTVEATTSGVTTAVLNGTSSRTEYHVGASYALHQSDKVKVWTEVRYNNVEWDLGSTNRGYALNSTAAGFNGQGLYAANTTMPVLVAAEVRAKDWLTLRGHISQSLSFVNTIETHKTSATTGGKEMSGMTRAMGAGAALHFDSVTIDGLLASQSTGNLGFDSNFMSRVGLTYNW